jgi:hypothetical protein
MENKFVIDFMQQEILIEQQLPDRCNNITYKVFLPDEIVEIEYTEDDEGAGRWLDLRTNHQTEISTELGGLIDLYAAQRKINL